MVDETFPDDVRPVGAAGGATEGDRARRSEQPTELSARHTAPDAAHDVTGSGTHDGAPGAGRDEQGEADIVDELPEDLDAAGYVGPYLFPDNARRRVPGYLYLATATACAALWLLVDGSPFVNGGMLLAAGLLAAFGAYHLLAGWSLEVDEQDALVIAVRTVGFPVGHASAQMGWRELRSRPLWRILLYSAENPPATRGLVLVDGVDGTVVEHFVEENPEDWSEHDGRLGSGDG